MTIADPGGEAAKAFEELAAEVEARKPRVRAHPELVVGRRWQPPAAETEN